MSDPSTNQTEIRRLHNRIRFRRNRPHVLLRGRSQCLDAVTERNCARWFAKFRAGDRSLQALTRSGRPQILDCQSLKAAVDADPSVTSRELAIEFGCCQKTIINGLHEIGKVCKRGRWIPFKLTENHKVQRMVTCQSMLSMAKKANFFDSILTGDEKWIAFDNTHRGLQ